MKQGKYSTLNIRRSTSNRAFTLIELLVVVAIIAIVASLSLVVIARVRENGRKTQALEDIHALKNAITEYYADTGTYPVSSTVMAAAVTNDFTYGGTSLDAVFGAHGIWSTDNSEVIAILMDREKYPSTGAPTVNFGHVKNIRRKFYLSNVDMVQDTSMPGLGPDLVFRDPWGNPYIISFDLNSDEKCRDAFYKQSGVSQQAAASGYNGLFNSSGSPDAFEYSGGVMIWSLGPDRTAKNEPATGGKNKDNIVSWK